MLGPWGPKDDNDDVNLAKLYYRKSATKRKKEMVPAKEQTRKVCVCVVPPIFHFSGELMRYVLTSRNFLSQELS
jgi:hypothetical protein